MSESETQLARLNRELRMVSRCNRALIRATSEDNLLHEICRLIVEIGGYPCAWVGYAKHDAERSIHAIAHVGIEAEYLESLHLSWADVPQGQGPAGRAIRERTTQVTPDILADPVLAPWIKKGEKRNYSSIVALPLIVGNDCIGALDIYSEFQNAFDETELALLRELADDLAYGIGALRLQEDHQRGQQNLRLFRSLLDRTNDFIYAVDAQTGQLLDANDVFTRKLGYTRAELLRMSARDFSVMAMERPWSGAAEQAKQLGSNIFETEYRARSGALFPVEVGLTYVEQDSHPYIVVVSREIVERKQQQAQIARLTRALRMQSAIGLAILRITDRDELLQEACRIAVALGGYDVAMVAIVDPDAVHARPVFRFGQPKRRGSPPVFTISDGTTPDTSLTGLALRTGKLTVCDDLTQGELPVVARDVLYQDGVRLIVALPLIVDGARIGVLTMLSPSPGAIADDELHLLQDMMTTLSFALRSQQQADTVKYLAYFDSVTGLAKRALFCERMDSFLSDGSGPQARLGVVAFCVDELGSLNDHYGGNFGDLVLKEVAERLRRHVDSDDRIGYIGGGIFVLMEPGVDAVDEGSPVALEGAVFGRPFSIDERVVRVSGCAGVALFGADGQDANALVRSAEAALRRVREARGRFRPEPLVAHSEISNRLALEHKLRRAIDARQFELHYLPQVELLTGRIAAVEALLRWNDPDAGLVLPDRFLPMLESSGLINTVGNWVLQRAIEDGIRWQALDIGPVRISVNVSALQLRRRAFVEYCSEQLGRWRVREAGYGIDLEFTEAALLQDVEGARRKLSGLRAVGARISLDDFGVGYSSLGMLSTLPLDLIKIDRSFIERLPHDAASLALVTSIVGLASAHGLVTVAEGVEEVAQLRILASLKCHQWQGYLFSPPVTVVEVEALLKAGAGARGFVSSALQA